jgi:hypothetical protein
VQVVGEDHLEVVADDDAGEVHVYLLDAEGKAIDIGDRKVTIALVADAPQVLTLTAHEGGYLAGTWKGASDPTRVTIVVRRAGKAKVAVVGWKPGVKLVVAGGPKVKIKAKGLLVAAEAKAKNDGKGGGPTAVKVDVKEKDGKDGKGKDEKGKDGKIDVKVDVKGNGNGNGYGNGNGNGDDKVKVKVKAK